MQRMLVAFMALALVGLGLTGCGLFRFEQREPWRVEAEEACLSQQMVQPTAYMSRASKIDGPGSCGMDYPIKVAAFSNGSVGVKQKLTLACPIIPRIDTWLDAVVKPAALLYFGVPMVDMKAGAYSCRPRNNRSGAKVSEHGYGNALDVMAFVLADGREVTVLRGWRGRSDEQDFLREVFVGACRLFTTVLGPGSDAHHSDHFHIDLARHDPRGERTICKPVLKFAPRIDMLQAGRRAPMTPAVSADLAPIDMEEGGPADEESRLPHRPAGPLAVPTYGAAPASPSAAGRAAYPAVPPARPAPGTPASPYAFPPVAQHATPEPHRGAPIYNRPPAPPQPRVLNGHGLY